VHQFTFVIVSSISFAKAEVQDAGLLFLSYMSHYLADRILNEGGSIEEVISTTIVTLGIATASLGAVLMLMGRFNCANAVSYLPLPVIGGYLAFIGYFCIVAGVGLCISKSMIDDSFVMDIQLLMDKQSFILAVPGLISGIIMTLVSRYAKNDIALPLTMIVIPGSFYFILYASGYTMEDAREYHWVGEETPPASIAALFDLFDFNQIRWDLVISRRCVTVWLGMVFVVSFSSCLDVAAISMEMG
jgi:SulP family sulfate permease